LNSGTLKSKWPTSTLLIRAAAAPDFQREPSERLAGAMIDAKHAERFPEEIVVQPVRRNRPTSDRSCAGPNACFGTFVLVPGKCLDAAIEIVSKTKGRVGAEPSDRKIHERCEISFGFPAFFVSL
jgi:hypothetical protein